MITNGILLNLYGMHYRSRKIIKLLKKDKELEDVDLVFIVPFVI